MAKGDEIRQAIDEKLANRRRGERYPIELRDRVLSYVESRIGDGLTVEKIG